MLSPNIFHSSNFWMRPKPHFLGQFKEPIIWTRSVDLRDFKSNEVVIRQVIEDRGEVKIIIQAKHEEGEDLRETKKTVKVPANVAIEKLKINFSERGLLVFKAPYKSTISSFSKDFQSNQGKTWGGVWGEMVNLMKNLPTPKDSTEGSVIPRTEFVANKDGGEDGVWRMHVNIGKGFKADEVKLRSHDNCIELEAKKEVKSDHGVSSRYISEVVSIPEGVDQDQLKSKFFENGDLTLEGPCKKVPKIEEDREGKAIPIEVGKSEEGEKTTVVQ